MKFSTIALIGAAAAKDLEFLKEFDTLINAAGTDWSSHP